jgi:glycosidase
MVFLIKEKGKNSQYADWFVINSYDNPDTPENEFDYSGWYGVQDLPEINEDENGPVEGFRNHIRNIVKRWGDPNGDGDPSDGIDGWRLDVAEMVSLEFWKDFRTWVKAINPEAYIVGEVWWEDFGNNKMFDASPWLAGDAFDAVMNYRFGDAMLKAFVDQDFRVSPSELENLLGFMKSHYSLENQRVLMNIMGSHDTERFASMVKNPDRWIDHGANMNQESDFDTRKPNDAERELQKVILAFQFTYLGAPFIFYGDEVGLWGADDPDCRKPMLWPNIEYEDETISHDGKTQERDVVEINTSLKNYYKKLIDLRNVNPALRTGNLKVLLTDDEAGFYIFERSDENNRFVMVFHLYDNAVEIPKMIQNRKDLNKVISVNSDNNTMTGRSCIIFKEDNQ